MLDDLVVDAMIEEDTRSRVRVLDDGIMVLLKAMHVGQDMARPEDMVSIRIWIDKTRVITSHARPMLTRSWPSSKSCPQGMAQPHRVSFWLILSKNTSMRSMTTSRNLEDAVNRIEGLVGTHQTEAEFACPTWHKTQSHQRFCATSGHKTRAGTLVALQAPFERKRAHADR